MRKVISSILLFLALASCSKDSNPVEPGDTSAFSIHLLQDSTIIIANALGHSLGDLKLSSTPWLSVQDIDFYDFSSHCIYLKAEKNSLFPTLDRGSYPSSWWAKPFVVTANGEPRYLGVFHGGLSSADWPVPYIEDLENTIIYPRDIIHISWIWLLRGDQDTRNDQTAKQCLEQANLCHAGIAVTLDAIQLLQNTDSATISYTFTATNNDIDALYVVDPDLMGAGLFHYYNNGPEIASNTDGNVYRSNHGSTIQPVPFDSWNPNWFVRLANGASMRRVVTLAGYPHFPSGNYRCEFVYCGPVHIERAQRTMSNGRYWIGPTTSTINGLIVQ
jgi:hypothetical protein